jgi:hypothetical protein
MTAMALFALVLTGCSTSSPGTTSGPTAAAPTVATSPSVGASASAAAGFCLPPELVTALDEIGQGNFEPGTPLNELADTFEALDLSQEAGLAEVRDELVKELRDTNPDQQRIDLMYAANLFRSDATREC